MKVRKIKSVVLNDEGSAIGIFVIVLLFMTIMATTTVTLAQTQFTWSRFSRRTSNSYQLAKSGAEKTIDSMNKEIAKVLPKLMDEASKNAHVILMADGVGYEQGAEPESGATGNEKYAGKYTGKTFENRYEIELRKLMYEHVSAKFATYDIPADTEGKPVTGIFEATKSDVRPTSEVKINVYKRGDILAANHANRGAIEDAINDLMTIADIEANAQKDAFAIEVMAWAEEGAKTSVTKSHLIGTVSLDQLKKDEQLLEEYEWADAFPEIFLSAITSFGDFIVNGNYKAEVKGDISVKGTHTKTDVSKQRIPEPGHFGGIVVSDGGELKVEGDALVVNNILATNSPTRNEEVTKITIDKDAIAETIAITDNSLESIVPWTDFVANNILNVKRNVYMENDLRIDRYVKNGEIIIGQSVFGVSDGDKNGVKDPTTDKIYVDPNKSSGIYAMGKFSDDSSKIEMKRAFIAGQAFIDFGDGNGFHRLHESAGEPFEDVYYLEEYRRTYGDDDLDVDGSIIGGDLDTYLTDFEDLIKKDRITIEDKHAYAPAKISEIGTVSNVPANFMAKEIFYVGLEGEVFPTGIKKALTGETTDFHWDKKMMDIDDNPTWESLILKPKSYYEGGNPFKKDYFKNPDSGVTPVTFGDLLAYKGLQGYMLGKRGVFYSHFVAGGTSGLTPVEHTFTDLINVGAFSKKQNWSRNNPITVVIGAEVAGDDAYQGKINISQYKNRPTAIVCTDSGTTLRLTSDSGNRDFTGIIITPGKIIIEEKMKINGVVIAGNESPKIDLAIAEAQVPPRVISKDIREGKHAGIKIESSNVTFKYDVNNEKDRNMLFDIRFIDKSLQRRLYDYLRLTNYAAGGESGDLDKIFVLDGRQKVKLSNESVISSEQEGLQFTMKSLKRIKSN